MKNRNSGITLIALVITIIVLLILAGIVIILTIGENGMINKAKESGLIYDEQQAKEKLELVLLDMQADKVTNPEYNQEEYLTKEIEENDMIVNGDIVLVNRWQFQIDRSVPEISAFLGKGQPNENIKLNVTATNNSDYAKSVIKVEIEYVAEIKYISIAEQEIAVPEKTDGKYVVEKEVTTNGNYGVLVKDTEDKYQIANVTVSDLAQDMNIYTKEDLETFRDDVNSGKTYEGKTIKVMNDIDLKGSESNQWIPIGNYGIDMNLYFKGTFDGNYKVISNLYINSTGNYQALFGNMNNGSIKNTILSNINITGKEYVAGLLAYGEGVSIEDCGVNGTINSTYEHTGGVVAYLTKGNINKCYNKANVTMKTPLNVSRTGGVVGYAINETKISNCYNMGNIRLEGNTSHGSVSGARVGGVVSDINNNSIVEYSYNTGTITSVGDIAEGAGIDGASMNSNINQCFNIGTINSTATIQNRSGNISAFTYYTSITNCYYVANNMIGFDYRGNSASNNKLDTISNIKSVALTILGADESIWKQSEGVNDGYPTLTWEK